jgi:protein involved in polysaccharide export with SLBB domain
LKGIYGSEFQSRSKGVNMMKRSSSICLIILLATAHPAFATEPEFSSQSRVTRQTQTAVAAEPSEPSSSYVLGPSDRVRLKVYGEQDITGDYEVDTNGYISVPLAGRVKAAGLTTRQLEKAVASALSKGLLRDPRVNAEVATYRPFFILGEVKKAGEYPYKAGLTVLDAVASAGGYTYRANESKVVIRRAGSNVEETVALDAPVPVFPGDNIRVPERYF